jgi:hypothetical protein
VPAARGAHQGASTAALAQESIVGSTKSPHGAKILNTAAHLSPDEPILRLTASQLCRYRQLRRAGVAAVYAHRSVTAAPPALRYRPGPGPSITVMFDGRRDLAGLAITATAEPDPAPDIDWLGEFTGTWSPEAIAVDGHRHRYFLPTYTATRRRGDLARRGYARGVAHHLAARAVRDDAHLARSLDHRLIRVEVRDAVSLLGVAVVPIDLAPGDEINAVIIRVIEECGMVEEVIDHARIRGRLCLPHPHHHQRRRHTHRPRRQ